MAKTKFGQTNWPVHLLYPDLWHFRPQPTRTAPTTRGTTPTRALTPRPPSPGLLPDPQTTLSPDHPPPDRPKFRFFFTLAQLSFFLPSRGSSRGILVFLKVGALKCARLEFSDPSGFRSAGLHTARELQTCTFQGPSASNTTKIPLTERRKKGNCGGRRKARNFGTPTLRSPTLHGPHFSGFGRPPLRGPHPDRPDGQNDSPP